MQKGIVLSVALLLSYGVQAEVADVRALLSQCPHFSSQDIEKVMEAHPELKNATPEDLAVFAKLFAKPAVQAAPAVCPLAEKEAADQKAESKETPVTVLCEIVNKEEAAAVTVVSEKVAEEAKQAA